MSGIEEYEGWDGGGEDPPYAPGAEGNCVGEPGKVGGEPGKDGALPCCVTNVVDEL
jgi:hypothetical protein